MDLLVTETQPAVHAAAASRRLSRERSAPAGLGAWVDLHPFRAFALLSVLYAVAVCALSSMKLLWLDELITLHIARLNSAHAIWNALAHGADPNPPLIHLAVMFCRRLFGEHELGLRLPAMLGYWLGMLSLFLFLKRRLPATWALAGTVLSMDMGGFEWSYESRSYAVYYGTTMLAVYCWSRVTELEDNPKPRWRWLVGMAMALAIGLCTNYFSVLAFVPIAVGESVRTFIARQKGLNIKGAVHWPVWACLVLAGTPLLAFRPLIEGSIKKYSPYAWNKVTFSRSLDAYSDMVETTLYPLLALLAFAIAMRWLTTLCGGCREHLRPRWIGRLASGQAGAANRLSLPDAAAVLVLMAYPLVGYVVATLHGGMMSPRFVIPVCFGFAIAGVMAAYRTFGHTRVAATGMLVFCLAWFMARESFIGYWYEEQKQAFYKVVDRMPPPEYPGEPIVVGDNLMVLPFQHYAPPAMAARVVYAIDFPTIMRDRGEASGEVNLWQGRGLTYHFPIVSMAALQRSTGRYIILNGAADWLIEDLSRHHYPVSLIPIDTRAGAANFYATPLSHGTPIFFQGAGDKAPSAWVKPIPFDEKDNLPKLP